MHYGFGLDLEEETEKAERQRGWANNYIRDRL